MTLASGCGGVGWRPDSAQAGAQPVAASPAANKTLAEFQRKDPGLARFVSKAYGVAVFPSIGKGAMVVGGAYGEGQLYAQGRLVGSTALTQLSVGWALGGQVYSEVIFFESKAALDGFKAGNFELGAQASAVAMTAGVSVDASYDNGVAIFTMAKGGLMYEAAVSGQKFSFQAL